jgi:glucokinase-like ROK family protein
MKRSYRTADQIWVRQHNLAVVLNCVWEADAPISRTHIVEMSGLNKGTVGSLLTDLEKWGFVKESGVSDPRPGRPAALMDINPDGGRVIGAEIGVDFISIILTDLKAQVIWSRKIESTGVAFARNQDWVLQQAEALVHEAIRWASHYPCRLLGIGLVVPGLVDHHSGTLLFAPNLQWRNVPLRDMWRQRFQMPVIVENDAKASALGEQMLGVAKQVDSFIYLCGGVGLGGSFVIDRKLYGGMGGFAGEVGHMTLDPNGPMCNCGNRGCWETLVSPTAIIQRVRQEVIEGRTPNFFMDPDISGNPDRIRMKHIVQAAIQGEPVVLKALDEVGRYLGIGIANLVNMFNPGLVVLGGVLSLVGPYILPRARQEIEQRAMAAARQSVEIKISIFKFDACVIGGVALIIQKILNNPAAWHSKQTIQVPFDNRLMIASDVL